MRAPIARYSTILSFINATHTFDNICLFLILPFLAIPHIPLGMCTSETCTSHFFIAQHSTPYSMIWPSNKNIPLAGVAPDNHIAIHSVSTFPSLCSIVAPSTGIITLLYQIVFNFYYLNFPTLEYAKLIFNIFQLSSANYQPTRL